jgi:hypothetical protein
MVHATEYAQYGTIGFKVAKQGQYKRLACTAAWVIPVHTYVFELVINYLPAES